MQSGESGTAQVAEGEAVFEIIRVSGRDGRGFLQGQLTQDVEGLDDMPSLLAAWCNPKGRVIAVMRMIDAGGPDNEIALAVPAGLAAALIQRFLMFRFRARVELTATGEAWTAHAVSDKADIAALEAVDLLPAGGGPSVVRARGLVAVDNAAAPRCVEVWGPVSAMQAVGLSFRRPLSDTEWKLALIQAGIPTIEAATTEKYTPHMLNLDCLGAISFSKGCYTGQEVVARTEHLGRARRRLMRFRMDAPGVAAGDRVIHDGQEVGEVVNVAGLHLLAVVPVELHREELSIDGRRASPVPLPYAIPPVA
jgi:folate-binding protein YgfZ